MVIKLKNEILYAPSKRELSSNYIYKQSRDKMKVKFFSQPYLLYVSNVGKEILKKPKLWHVVRRGHYEKWQRPLIILGRFDYDES